MDTTIAPVMTRAPAPARKWSARAILGSRFTWDGKVYRAIADGLFPTKEDMKGVVTGRIKAMLFRKCIDGCAIFDVEARQ